MAENQSRAGKPFGEIMMKNSPICMAPRELAEVCQKKKIVVLVSRNDKENSEYAAEVCEYVKQNNSNDILYFSLKLKSDEFKSLHPELTVEVNDTPALSIDELENIEKSRNNSSKMSMIVINDLWLMAIQNTYTTKKEEIEEILSKIKQLVEQEKITVLALVLQELFGVGQVKGLNEFTQKIIDLKPYSVEGGIDVMENVLTIQEAIDTQKKIEFKLGVYRYTSDGTIELDFENRNIQCMSPLQIMMSNGRYYVIVKNERKLRTQDFLFYRIDLMDEIEIIETKRRDVHGQGEWKNPQKFLVSNPFFYSGKKEDIVIGFEEQQITQVVDWFGTEENGLFECLGTYYMEKPENMVKVKMVKLRFPEVNVMAFSFWIMQYMDCVEILEGDLLKKTLKERMKWALEKRIK